MEGLTICNTRRAAPVPFFPHEIIEQILLKLPAISLLQFKCVCKSWRDLISTHEFAIQNLIETSERFRRLGVIESKILREGRISLYSLATQASSLAEEAEEETICVPAANKFASVKILGSCNGMLLICLKNVKGSNLNPRKFLLWNPTIREFKMIPPCDFKSSCRSLVSGFGYNSSIDNYKAVVVFYERKSDSVCGYVYNLRTNSWKRLESFYFPYKCAKLLYNHRDIYLPNEIGTTLVNGAPHWVTLSVSVFEVNKIIYFDLEDEKFKEFQSPPPSAGTFKTFLSIYEDCICENRLRREDSYIEFTLEVWIMKKYGVKES
ncbi:F-box/kelch-repeat protein At3g23880-like [Mangifera indica]|uniref:F-box/kelch-repeat protein At3g23880-like n=1 Tax=Mangifera indica TaxID=29780 RepID=UPI001CF96834|nr:F-box/kelch-repeat protein At3g23880-like [Mangifera indica]